VISNYKSWLCGTFHGVSVDRLQEYSDNFSFNYSHRRGDPFADLLFELVRWPHVSLSEIKGCHVAMPRHEDKSEPGKEHNKWLRRKLRESKERAEAAPERPRDVAEDIPADLAAALDAAFGPSREPQRASEPTRPGWQSSHSEIAWEFEFFGSLVAH